MKLTELEPRFYAYAGGKSMQEVEQIEEADSVLFLCPACFEKNEGPVGTHGIRVDFIGRNMPDDMCIHNSQGHPVRWNFAGSGLHDLSLTPSILLLSGCAWHGFITNGEILTC